MPFKAINVMGDDWKQAMRRTVIVGPPNSWKTSALRTWPGDIHVLLYPGEHGASAIPQEPRIKPYVWEEPAQDVSARSIYREVVQTTLDILSGAHGPVTTFAGDGLHKLYGLIWQMEFEKLAETYPHTPEDKLSLMAYRNAHKTFTRYLQKVNSSTVPYVVFTVWAGRDKDDPDDTSRNPSKHVWPDLPGDMAKNILGEAGTIFFSEPGREVTPGKFSAGRWQTRPQGRVWGAGIKLPPNIAVKVPTFIDQDWQKFEALVESIEKQQHTAA